MPFGNRVLVASGLLAECDRLDIQVVYNGPSDGSALPYLPVYQDLSDAAQYNSKLPATANGQIASGGKVVLGTSPNAGELVGVILPQGAVSSNAIFGSAPNGINKGDVIVVRAIGIAIVALAVKTTGTAATVGSYAIGDKTQNNSVVGAPVIGNTIGQIVATATAVVPGATIPGLAIPTTVTSNGYVNVRVHAR